MKKAFRNIKLYILGLVLGALGVGIPLGIYGITVIPALNANPFPYPFLMAAIAFLYLLLGFTISDIQIARWRHKTSEYDTKLPQEMKDKAWSIRFPFYLAAAVVLSVFLFFEIWYWFSGGYPLPVEI